MRIPAPVHATLLAGLWVAAGAAFLFSTAERGGGLNDYSVQVCWHGGLDCRMAQLYCHTPDPLREGEDVWGIWPTPGREAQTTNAMSR